MPISTKKTMPFEILVATMHQTSLLFLEKMFSNISFLELPILIVNQTTPEKLLASNSENIRIINSFEKGLAQSRNLAIEHAVGDFCLIADDDVVYANDFVETISNGFETYGDADIITFQMTDLEGSLFRAYPDIEVHDKKSIATANSVVIAFRRKNILDGNVNFNPNFGLGSTFQTANEYVFLRNALKARLKLFFVPKVILAHERFSSGQDLGSDRIIFARGALYYKYSGILGYLRIGKDIFLAYKQNYFQRKAFWGKLQVAFNGISKYKELVKQGKEIK